MKLPQPGLGAFTQATPLGMSAPPVSTGPTAAPTAGIVTHGDSLHLDQDRYRNLTNTNVESLNKLTTQCLHAIDLAVQRLDRFINADLGDELRREIWNGELSCRWWGEFDVDVINTARERFRSTAATMQDPATKYHLRSCSTNITPPFLGTVHLGSGFFSYTKWKQLDFFIHELSHLAGVWNLIERYGREQALALAQRRQRAVLRNSDNYAYYAQDCYLVELGHKDQHDLDACFVYPYDAGYFKNSTTSKPHMFARAPW